MPNLNVAVLGQLDYSNELGKKGTSTEITFFNLKKGEDTVTFIEPTKYPERIASLFYATSITKKAILVVDQINAAFGESVLMLHCTGVKDGLLVLKNFMTPEKVAPLIKGTVVEKYEVVPDDKNMLRERLLEEVNSLKTDLQLVPSSGTVTVDHSFNVKGVGTVILGTVANGVVRKHDSLNVLPGQKIAQVRSIQKHDDDFELAIEGDRVGLALKNIEADGIDRGNVLTNDSSIKTTKDIEGQAELVNYWPAPLKDGMALHLGHWMQFLPAKVAVTKDGGDWKKPVVKLALEKDLVYKTGDRAVITYLAGGKLRVVGTIGL